MSKKSNAPGIFNTQFITSCLSISLVLILLGTIVFFVFTAKNLSDYMRENINISLLLDDRMDEKTINAFKAELEARPYVKSLEYISKEQGLETVKAEMGADPSEFLGFNPITASFEVKLKSEYANNDSIQRILDEMKMNSNVVDVLYQKDLINSVNNNIRKISIIMLIIAALFTYISFALINNTVRLSIFSQRFVINTMKLVGASWWFIRKPFLKRGLLLGVISATIATVFLYFGIKFLKEQEPQLGNVITNEIMTVVALCVYAFGLVITFCCIYFSLGKYLRMSSNTLYHI
ncbi:MAG: permease-like cell division protein FtsX [Bacteroidaceae bacterium]|nr:permease-like cell division protein FtsX [Bacteroidaceae bacterium]